MACSAPVSGGEQVKVSKVAVCGIVSTWWPDMADYTAHKHSLHTEYTNTLCSTYNTNTNQHVYYVTCTGCILLYS